MSTAFELDAATLDAEPGFYPASVLSATAISPSMVRIVLGGPWVERYVGLDAPDECVTVFFPAAVDDVLPPMTCCKGVWGYHDAATRPECRNYTVRTRDDDTLTIDFVLHESGVASNWARLARPGHSVVLSRPRSWYRCPEDAAWQLLVADQTGLPAIARALEQAPARLRTHVVLEVLDPADIQSFDTAADVTVDWRVGTGNGVMPSVLPDAVASYERPAGTGYVWFAGEAGASRAVRSHVRKQWGMSTRECSVIGYWRERAEEWLASYKRYEAMALAGYKRALREGKSEAQAQEEFEALLERVGL
ncbi:MULTISPECIES: siderophore-interacting protein [Nocardiaceae]|uniref:NADPH-dependent ferric siderophore reductase n=1 Tax=Rhodococcoides corynebacterioides TaxID=53972 RepID=A0ABS2KNG2_9NOCA|nr:MULTISPECIES: siderophore-interacting protein [Rhodococcus]MBM7413509.1 NADPH-dependent ferric siderophore reductase [Rhodococcus corynebacterioides]MBP1115972.1 NADPH-dependent ferric siderophore reductase [Rhodococcus sp. PvP016]